MLIRESIRTNIHYVLNNKNIAQAGDILCGKYNEVLSGVNSVIFLTYKPHGRGGTADIEVLSIGV
jgi:hypothetical protein